MSKLYFATIFNINYLSRARAMIDSLAEHHQDFVMFVVALDKDTELFFKGKQFENVRVITTTDIAAAFPELVAIKNERSFVNYIFTLSPYYPLYILQNNPEIPHICSLDTDQFFFSSPQKIFDLLDKYSVLITPHRFTKKLLATDIEKYGKFNVSFQVFKNDRIGLKCLQHWKEQCALWCADQEEDGKFADQKYLDEWPSQFGNSVGEISHVGLGLAPWNINNQVVSVKNKKIWVGDQPLVLFHYQGLRILEELFVYTAFDSYLASMTPVIKKQILKPILKSIFAIQGYNPDNIARNKNAFSAVEVKPESKSSYFKFIKGEMFTFEQYLQMKNIKSGTLGRVKKFFGK